MHCLNNVLNARVISEFETVDVITFHPEVSDSLEVSRKDATNVTRKVFRNVS